MTAVSVADVLGGRPTGQNRWMANCPAHDDGTPSLSISEGKGGRVLLHCFAGCMLAEILEGAGLGMPDLFNGPSKERAGKAARKHARKVAVAAARRKERIRLTSLYRRWWRVNHAAGTKLASASDDSAGACELARLFHQSIERLRELEIQLAGVA